MRNKAVMKHGRDIDSLINIGRCDNMQKKTIRCFRHWHIFNAKFMWKRLVKFKLNDISLCTLARACERDLPISNAMRREIKTKESIALCYYWFRNTYSSRLFHSIFCFWDNSIHLFCSLFEAKLCINNKTFRILILSTFHLWTSSFVQVYPNQLIAFIRRHSKCRKAIVNFWIAVLIDFSNLSVRIIAFHIFLIFSFIHVWSINKIIKRERLW